jgi:hypothetical protein
MGKGLDSTGNCGPKARQLVNNGYTFVARYYSHSAWKNLGPAEAKQLSAAGLAIVAVWESAGNHVEFFTSSQGQADGAAAVATAKKTAQPEGSPIYFAVDFDAGPDDLTHSVIPYFEQVHAAVRGAGYFVGVYGSGLTCSHIQSAGYANFFWLAQSTGWAGFTDFTSWNIKQGAATTILGEDADLDESDDHAGGFRVA